jgi:putative (di)nucleoside polyphosphate hydrolase
VQVSLVDRERLVYRPCVGAFLLNADKKVWIGKRDEKLLADAHLYQKKHLWQLPQGGIDAGETPKQALTRELFEETGVKNFEIIGTHPDWLTYDLPDHLIGKALKGGFRGQSQKWFAANFLGEGTEINLNAHKSPEFTDWRWADLDELLDCVVPFKLGIYKKVVAAFRHLCL